MLSLIEVTCPHCAAQGQIMLPPLGAIIIGPCPECQGMVAVFCGKVLGLDTEIMTGDSESAKRDHVSSVLTDFVRNRVAQLFASPRMDTHQDHSNDTPAFGNDSQHVSHSQPNLGGTPISTEELESFRDVDLRLLDDARYFKAIFHRE
jgi:hypothetical protein